MAGSVTTTHLPFILLPQFSTGMCSFHQSQFHGVWWIISSVFKTDLINVGQLQRAKCPVLKNKCCVSRVALLQVASRSNLTSKVFFFQLKISFPKKSQKIFQKIPDFCCFCLGWPLGCPGVDFFQDQAWNLLRAISDGEISTVANPDCWGGKQKNPTRLVVEPNPSEKICSSNWILSPNFRGDFLKKKDELPPPRISSIMKTWIFGMLPATFGCFFWYPRSQGGKKKNARFLNHQHYVITALNNTDSTQKKCFHPWHGCQNLEAQKWRWNQLGKHLINLMICVFLGHKSQLQTWKCTCHAEASPWSQHSTQNSWIHSFP